jgi:uncharacterized protein (TIGR02118 family)
MIVLAKRNPQLTREEFTEYWRDNHGPLVSSVTECSRYMRKYVQNHLITADATLNEKASASLGPAPPNAAVDFDGILEVWYDSIEDLQKSASSQSYMDLIRPDELKFADPENCVVFMVSEHVVFDEDNHPVTGRGADVSASA